MSLNAVAPSHIVLHEMVDECNALALGWLDRQTAPPEPQAPGNALTLGWLDRQARIAGWGVSLR